ncbi:MAG: RDD family protein [Pseudohongiellaceae bacterium]
MNSRPETGKTLLSAEEIADLPRAGLWRRIAALLYDMFLVAAIWMSLGFVLQLLFGPGTSELVEGEVQTDPVVSRVMLFMMVTSAAAFYIGFWRKTGQTLGMIAWRIRVLGTDNRPLDVKAGLSRFFLAWPAFWLLGLGYLWMYVDPQRDAAHERLSGSKTVLLPKHARPF